MSLKSKRKGWPVPDAASIAKRIYEIEKGLFEETRFKPDLAVISTDQKPGQVDLTDRDRAVHILRCLKHWFELPGYVFISATNILDRFLTKMKVQHKYLACATVSCLNIAVQIHKFSISPSNLVNISQSKCSIRDLDRMSKIIRAKLEMEGNDVPFTTYNYLNMFLEVFESVAYRLDIKAQFSILLQRKNLLRRLEVVLCSSSCAYERPSIIVLAVMQYEIQRFLSNEIPSKSSYFSVEMLQLLTTMLDLQCICGMTSTEFITCHGKISELLINYDNHKKVEHCQKLVWQYSFCTLNNSKPSKGHFPVLQSIVEE